MREEGKKKEEGERERVGRSKREFVIVLLQSMYLGEAIKR